MNPSTVGGVLRRTPTPSRHNSAEDLPSVVVIGAEQQDGGANLAPVSSSSGSHRRRRHTGGGAGVEVSDIV